MLVSDFEISMISNSFGDTIHTAQEAIAATNVGSEIAVPWDPPRIMEFIKKWVLPIVVTFHTVSLPMTGSCGSQEPLSNPRRSWSFLV